MTTQIGVRYDRRSLEVVELDSESRNIGGLYIGFCRFLIFKAAILVSNNTQLQGR